MNDHRIVRRADEEALAQIDELNSRRLIATPALVCDLAMLLANIEAMASNARNAGVSLRPHVKSQYKSAYIAKRQLDAGAVGLSFAKLGEAEVIVEQLRANDERAISVLLTSPLVGRHRQAESRATHHSPRSVI